MKKIYLAFTLAFDTIRTRFFHTLLSVLGIIIGVAALVAILSLIDGMERYAKEQITRTTSLKAIVVNTSMYKKVDNVRMRKEKFDYLDYEKFKQLEESFTHEAKGYFFHFQTGEVQLSGQEKPIGSQIRAAAASFPDAVEILYGRLFKPKEVDHKTNVVVINYKLAQQFAGKNQKVTDKVLGKTLNFQGKQLKVIGVLKGEEDKTSQIIIPITLVAHEKLKQNPPQTMIEAEDVTKVPVIKTEVEKWLEKNMPNGKDDFRVYTNEQRVEQVSKGILLFKVIMGLIVGISVVVGGIGVMNVLLISVNERTTEIGVRKAVGAKRRDIVMQFLCESITVSAFGSLLGVVLGILATMIFIPIIKAITEVEFYAAYTFNTLLVIAIIALLEGIIFGTYPALRASRLDPVEAIRRE